jgi:hypothetical protein
MSGSEKRPSSLADRRWFGRKRGNDVLSNFDASPMLKHAETGKKKVSKKNVMKAKSDFLKSNTSITSDVEEQKLIPRGTFAGTIYQLGFLQDGRVVAADTGDQGGGQN